MGTQRIIRQENSQTEDARELKVLGQGNEQTEVLLSSDELNEIFDEWNLVNKGNLSINMGIYEKLQAYIEHQKKLKPLKQELAMQLLEKYIVPNGLCDTEYVSYKVYLNEKYIAPVKLYSYKNGSDGISIIRLSQFKYIISRLGNNMISNIDSNENDKFIDLRLWILEMKGEYIYAADNKVLKITIPI